MLPIAFVCLLCSPNPLAELNGGHLMAGQERREFEWAEEKAGL